MTDTQGGKGCCPPTCLSSLPESLVSQQLHRVHKAGHCSPLQHGRRRVPRKNKYPAHCQGPSDPVRVGGWVLSHSCSVYQILRQWTEGMTPSTGQSIRAATTVNTYNPEQLYSKQPPPTACACEPMPLYRAAREGLWGQCCFFLGHASGNRGTVSPASYQAAVRRGLQGILSGSPVWTAFRW